MGSTTFKSNIKVALRKPYARSIREIREKYAENAAMQVAYQTNQFPVMAYDYVKNARPFNALPAFLFLDTRPFREWINSNSTIIQAIYYRELSKTNKLNPALIEK